MLKGGCCWCCRRGLCCADVVAFVACVLCPMALLMKSFVSVSSLMFSFTIFFSSLFAVFSVVVVVVVFC